MPFLASYYYSQTQHVKDVRYVVDYLYEHAYYRPEKKYWWLAPAADLARHKLKDTERALKAAAPLGRADKGRYGVRELPAFVHERRGEMEDAKRIIEDIQAHSENIPAPEL